MNTMEDIEAIEERENWKLQPALWLSSAEDRE